ncbi:hypothetical protein [Neobacillus kokaensis]|uniref:Uncharacterized protein n=1 Tax=Neobacillus kokaensis TaxID=2759023 RepID=A0ABQ3N823_9BACI|nr:hypothetical protein [Neobacillus kokaensis]GHH98650.1 hypothetical protein AM1BK_21930 [Neobacillus kokaensis]
MSDFDKKLDIILHTLVEFKEEFSSYKSETNERLEPIHSSLSKIEKDQPEDITSILEQINYNLDERDSELEAFNKRVFKVESGMSVLLVNNYPAFINCQSICYLADARFIYCQIKVHCFANKNCRSLYLISLCI